MKFQEHIANSERKSNALIKANDNQPNFKIYETSDGKKHGWQNKEGDENDS